MLGEAARDARVRATAYAEALGLRLGEVELISELEPAAEPVAPVAREAMMMAKAGGDMMAEVSVSGGLVELNANVYVRFATLS